MFKFVKLKHRGKIIVTIIIMFTIILSHMSSNIVLAVDGEVGKQSVQIYKTSAVTPSAQTNTSSPLDVIGSIFAWLIRVIPVSIANGIGKILSTIGAAITGQNLVDGLTLDKILFNEVELTSIDFFSKTNDVSS